MSENVVETLVGAAVLAAAAGFMYYASALSGATADADSYTLKARFFRADSIAPGSEVRVAGVRVGSVRTVSLDREEYRAVVEMTLPDGLEFTRGSAVRILSDGLLGGAYLSIEPGGGFDPEDMEILAPGEEFINSQDSVNMMDLVRKSVTGGGE